MWPLVAPPLNRALEAEGIGLGLAEAEDRNVLNNQPLPFCGTVKTLSKKGLAQKSFPPEPLYPGSEVSSKYLCFNSGLPVTQ